MRSNKTFFVLKNVIVGSRLVLANFLFIFIILHIIQKLFVLHVIPKIKLLTQYFPLISRPHFKYSNTTLLLQRLLRNHMFSNFGIFTYTHQFKRTNSLNCLSLFLRTSNLLISTTEYSWHLSFRIVELCT
jgi:hypothetical protein